MGLVNITIDEIRKLPPELRRQALRRYHTWLKKQRRVDKTVLKALETKVFIFKHPEKKLLYRRRYYEKLKLDPERLKNFRNKQKRYNKKRKNEKTREVNNG